MSTHQKKHIKNTGNKRLLEPLNKNEVYGIVQKSLGACRFECQLLNNQKINAGIIGKMKGHGKDKVLKENDLVLIEKDSIQTPPIYTIQRKFNEDEKKELKKMGENITLQVRTDQEGTAQTRIIFEGEKVAEPDEEKEIDIDDI